MSSSHWPRPNPTASELLPPVRDEATPVVDDPRAIRSAVAYAGRTAVLATKHGKLDQIAPAMRGVLGIEVVGVSIDTDQLGTFSGEIPRTLSELDCAIAKARLAMTERGSDLGMASEGTFSPHPDVPWLTTDRELVVLVDDQLDHVFWECAVSVEVTAITEMVDSEADLTSLALRADLPRHAVIVRPAVPSPRSGHGAEQIYKGIRRPSDLSSAVEASCAASGTCHAMVTTDFRAHCCPSRQIVIADAAERLAHRVASRCRECGAAGWGTVDSVRGVPCHWCGHHVPIVRAEIDGCWNCGVRIERSVGETAADPGMCDQCNP